MEEGEGVEDSRWLVRDMIWRGVECGGGRWGR